MPVASSRQQGAAGTGRPAGRTRAAGGLEASRAAAGRGADARSRSRGSRTAGGGVVEMSGRAAACWSAQNSAAVREFLGVGSWRGDVQDSAACGAGGLVG